MSEPAPIAPVTANAAEPSDFIRDIVAADLASGKHTRIHTRFPPEPNGYLHIGHAKSICLNFGIARQFDGICNLRMDDTNPTKEDTEYVDSIQADVNWLIAGWADDKLGLKLAVVGQASSLPGSAGFQPAPGTEAQAAGWKPEGLGRLPACTPVHSPKLEPFYASDYSEQLYAFALKLLETGKAFVCDLTAEQMAAHRGTPTQPGTDSPFRTRSAAENLELFARMRAGEFPDGARTLRAKIDMASPNVHLRDPALYRIRHAEHHRTGTLWCLYPMYDYAHPLSDYLEGITHSICTLEFEVHRPFYDWILRALDLPNPLPRQIEFARLNLGYTVMSKRKLLQLVEEKLVTGWDDPRLPTISGMRRRGVTASALRAFAAAIGVTKFNGLTDVALLEHTIRNELNAVALRRLAVLRPIKVVITNYPLGQTEELDATNNPGDEHAGTRKVPFSRELFIEREDFAEVPPPKFFRLKPGGEVRLKYAYIIKCDEVVNDAAGNLLELRCTADLDSKTGGATSGRKVKGTIHWVSAPHAVDAEVRLYDRLFTVPEPDAAGDFKSFLNPHSLEVITAKCEPSLNAAESGLRYQFERLAYCALDQDSAPGRLVFNRTITLKDAWTKEAGKG
jgi:glutaminyl-tRNA synthetase